MRKSLDTRLFVGIAGMCLASCSGQIGSVGNSDWPGNGSGDDPAGGGGSGSDVTGVAGGSPILDPGIAGGDPALADPSVAGPIPLRRLTQREYRNTVRDLLGIPAPDVSGFPLDRRDATGFPTPDVVGGSDARALQDAAEKAASAAMTKLSSLVPCSATDDACARQFIGTFGRRAYRRPLDAGEITNLLALYTKVRTSPDLQLGFPDAIRVLVSAMLQSPSFLYRRELGAKAPTREGDRIRLDGNEIASQLSYFLWSTMPDQELFAAADAGKLSTPDEVNAQARRMLADARARAAVETFHESWLGLDVVDSVQKDAQAFPEWTPELRQSLVSETRAFVDSVVLDGDGRFETLFTAPYSFVNPSLAALYGVKGVTGTALQRRDLDPSQRSGLLTEAGVLALKATPTDSDPIRRGKMVRLAFLCQALPPPPADVPPLPPLDPSKPRRAQFADHEVGACGACHVMMDPIGFGFENYDGVGRFRSIEKVSGLPIDASGTIRDMTPGQDVTFNGVKELGGLLAKSETAQRCLVTQWLRFGLGRGEVTEDLFSMNSAYTALSASDGNIREMLLALTKSQAFRYRTPSAGEVL